MNPSDFRICHLQFRYSLYACVALKHKYGSPVLHDSSSTAYHPCYPERYDDPLSFSQIIIYGFPPVSTGSASPLQVDEATYRFTCVTVCSFAQRKLTTLDYSNAASFGLRRCTNNSSYGTLTRLDLSPITAYGHDT